MKFLNKEKFQFVKVQKKHNLAENIAESVLNLFNEDIIRQQKS